MDHRLSAIAAWVFAMTGHVCVPSTLRGRRAAGTLLRFQETPLRLATCRAADVVVRLAQALLGHALVDNAPAVPMLFLSGAAAPIEVMPAAVQRAAQVNPLCHAVALPRGAWFGEP
jgi:hypothetical protein